MFRNPRDDSSLVVNKAVVPSVGRPPTPPNEHRGSQPNPSPYFPSTGKVPTMSTASSPPGLPHLGRQVSAKSGSVKRNGFKQNQSILSFFGKAPTKPAQQEDGLFFESPKKQDTASNSVKEVPGQRRHRQGADVSKVSNGSDVRYNENETPVKRRRVSTDTFGLAVRTPSPERGPLSEQGQTSSEANWEIASVGGRPQKRVRHRGGFVDDSEDDSEDEVEDIQHGGLDEDKSADNERRQEGLTRSLSNNDESSAEVTEIAGTVRVPFQPPDDQDDAIDVEGARNVPSLSREGTSMFIQGDFDENEDFENDEFFEGGEEFMERRWMEEQREMEMAFDEDSKSESDTSAMTPTANDNSDAEAACPICNGSLKGLTDLQASSHVNACLDGTATALPALGERSQSALAPAIDESNTVRPGKAMSKRFQRAAVARPAQSNPFTSAKDGKSGGGSAFTRLMSGHAEDAAWAEAASSEAQSRGKPAYQRTCPFYKIMPGLYICVDAFRYGKVEGQNAYFLSHFHSDHYIGLTSSWCHGPIYASKVTTNLIRQQLRVDARWLVPLEFEKKIEVPNTKGVFVTMIPANHCPGSSLFLFEKAIGGNKDGSPKLNRILHCGDFRACPAHVSHPLLKPDVLDAVGGHTKQQTIDTCYLDTTYLTPKYAFPSQHDVIDACAQMCVSLSKEIPDGSDAWEKAKLERAGSTMTKFLDKSESLVKEETDEAEDKKPKLRGKLLVVIGTYSIGKERICLGIARALGSKIYAPPAKMRICSCLEDEELNSLLTSNPLEAQVHMQTLMEIRAETLHDYLVTYKGRFSRVVGFRPTGWSYRPPTSRFTENPAVNNVLHSEGWKSRFTMRDLMPQRGSTKESNCFGVPYSEHSSFRELTMFCCALRIGRVIPTVNVGSAKSREKMKGWIEKWDAEKKKNGLFEVEVGAEGWGSGDGKLRYGV